MVSSKLSGTVLFWKKFLSKQSGDTTLRLKKSGKVDELQLSSL
jgi:hypothetical protein